MQRRTRTVKLPVRSFVFDGRGRKRANGLALLWHSSRPETQWLGMSSVETMHVIVCILGGSTSLTLTRSARKVVIAIICCARENDVGIENDNACREQQGKAESSLRCAHCLGTLLIHVRQLGFRCDVWCGAVQVTEHRHRTAH